MKKSMINNGGILAAFAVACTLLIAVTFLATEDTIEQQIIAKRLSILQQLIPAERYNNDIQHDCVRVTAPGFLGTAEPMPVYRARMDQTPVAIAIETIAPNGYNGEIDLIVGIDSDGVVLGVRTLQHKETPGLGDKIELRVSDWILDFNGQSITTQNATRWKVKKDGGQFDQFTGATITPRAVVGAVKRTVEYYQKHSQQLFEQPSNCYPQTEDNSAEAQ